MPDDRLDLRHLELRELAPWLHLFRGFRIALDLKKITLGAAGALLMSIGWVAIAAIFAGSPSASPDRPATTKSETDRPVATVTKASANADRSQPLSEARRMPWHDRAGQGLVDVYRSPLNGGWYGPVPSSAFLVLEPVRRLTYPAKVLFLARSSAGSGLLLTIWTLLVWALFGGAITRIAAVQITRESPVGLLQAVRFVAARYTSYLGAIVLPLAAIAVIVFLCAIGGSIARIPVLNVLMGILWVLALVAGMVLSLGLIGLVLGWPLMYPAISAEATESFDALSRSFSYVLGRPWQYLFYAALATLYGAVVMVLVTTVAYGAVHMSQYAVSALGGETTFRAYYERTPEAGGWRDAFGPKVDPETGLIPDASGADGLTAALVGFWTHLLFLGVVGFAYSFFWSETTIMYLLLRRDVDDTEFEEVFLDEEEEEPFPTLVAPAGPPPAPTTPDSPIDPLDDGSLPIIEPPI